MSLAVAPDLLHRGTPWPREEGGPVGATGLLEAFYDNRASVFTPVGRADWGELPSKYLHFPLERNSFRIKGLASPRHRLEMGLLGQSGRRIAPC